MGGDWGPEGFSESVTKLAQTQNPVTINSGGGFLNVGTFDMRDFTGYYLVADAAVSGAAAYCAIRGNLTWSVTDEGTPGIGTAYRQDYEWWASTPAPAANQEAMFSGFKPFQDRCHGTHLNVAFSNFGTSNVTLTYSLYGSTRPWGDSPFTLMSPYDDMMYENANIFVAGGTNWDIPLPSYYGRIGIHREAIAPPGPTSPLYIQWGSAIAGFYAYHNMAANNTDGNPQYFEIIAPHRPALLRLNAFGGNITDRLVITALRNRV